MPSIRTVGYLAGQTSATPQFIAETIANAGKDRNEIVLQSVAGADGIDAALSERMKRDGAEAIVAQPILTGHRDRIIVLATAARLPVISDYPLWPEVGALASLGSDHSIPIRRAAYYVDRVLKGAKPGHRNNRQTDHAGKSPRGTLPNALHLIPKTDIDHVTLNVR